MSIVRFFQIWSIGSVAALLGVGLFTVPTFAAETLRIDSFQTTAPSMLPNNPMVFSWQAKNADSCIAFGGWSGVKGVTGNEKVASPNETTTYGLQCSRGGATARAQFQILVNSSQIFFDFTTPQQYALVPKDAATQIAWRGLPAAGACSLNAGGLRIPNLIGDGSQIVSPPFEGVHSYKLECARPGVAINSPTITLVSYVTNKNRYLNVASARDGDWAGKFQVASVRALYPANPKDPYSDRANAQNARIDLRGRATVSGAYHYYPNIYGTVAERNRICMNDLDGASEQQLPQLAGNVKDGSRFCFNNGDAAARLLGAQPGTSGVATVVIDGYTLIGDEKGLPDETYLLSVSAHRQTAPIKVNAEPEESVIKNPQGQPVVIYLQPNQVIRIENIGETVATQVVKTPAKKKIVRVTKIAPKRKVIQKSTQKSKPSSSTFRPPKGQSTIKKIIPKASARGSEAPAQRTTQIVRLYDAYIN